MLQVGSIPTPVALDPNAAYIIAGGLGGLGISISTWMAEHGAKHLIFVSRTNGTEPDALDAIQELQSKGIKTDTVVYNERDGEEVVAAIRDISRTTTVKGVVHAAMGEDVSLVF
jgi:NAD(P)-dependent dehydrogenase (short-subunit alcohol dehydrogenase family)